MAKRRKQRKSALSAVLALLAGLAVMMAIGFGIWKVLRTDDFGGYPVKYTDLILQAARENDIPAAYIAAVIMTESSYNPAAASSLGARGLMQMMPGTARDVAGWLGETFDPDALFDPETSIRYGARYLRFLMERYGGDEVCSSAAYFAGFGTVDGYLRNPSCSADGKTLDRIPAQTVDTYVKRMLKYYDYYSKKYAQIGDMP